jgi:exosome complex RNA-binding protein Rrp42 (RNase PH superfamily)
MCRSSEDEVMITRLLEKSIRRTEAVDREALCIVAGEKVGRIAMTRADTIDPSHAGLAATINAALFGG